MNIFTVFLPSLSFLLPSPLLRFGDVIVVEEIFAFGNRLRSTHCRDFNYLKLCRAAYFVRTAQLYKV